MDSSPYLNCGARSEIRDVLSRISPFQRKFGKGNAVVKFDKRKVRLREAVEARLADLGFFDGTIPLERLHERLQPNQITADESGQTPIAVAFYEAGPAVIGEFHNLLKGVFHEEIFGEPLYFQETPTFRFSFPESPGYTWRPNYHTDLALGHPPMEINVWMPLTECLADNSLIYAELDDSLPLWQEYDFDFSRFHRDLDHADDLQARCASISKPLLCDYGDLFLFDSRSMHLSQRNRTNQTRVSIDFRVVPMSDSAGLAAGYEGTGRRRLRFEPGGYYAPETTSGL